MVSCRGKSGFTLIEMLVIVALLLILGGISASVLTKVESKNKERQTLGVFALLDSAFDEYADLGYTPVGAAGISNDDEREFYTSLKFPPDCNAFTSAEIEVLLEELLDADDVVISGFVDDPNNSSNEAMCFMLSRVPSSRSVLDRLDSKLVSNLDSAGDARELSLTFGTSTRRYPYIRILDGWGQVLRYDYYDESLISGGSSNYSDCKDSIRSYPVVTSSGPDKIFGTIDDLRSR